jgi:hypothetical protein
LFIAGNAHGKATVIACEGESRYAANYCRRMIEFLQPDFLLTGIESNELLNNQPKSWSGYREFSRRVQRELHERFPQLPLSESVTLHKLVYGRLPSLGLINPSLRMPL